MNKPLAIGLIIFFILVIAGGAIWLAMRPAEEQTTAERGTILRFPFGLFGGGEEQAPAPTTTETTGDPEKQVLTLLSPDPVESFAVVKNGVRFIEKQTGKVSESGPQGEEQTRISNTTITKIFDVSWSPNASYAFLKYRENGNTRAVSAEFVATSTRASVLSSNIISAVFAPDRDRIAYLVPATSGSRLISANPDNIKQTDVATLPFEDFEIFWPEANSIYMQSRPSGLSSGFLFKYDLKTGSLEKILADYSGLQVKFSKNGQKLIYSSYDASVQKPRLYLYDTKSKNSVGLQTQGLAEKCAFNPKDDRVIYCAQDQNMTPATYPDSWLKGEISTSDYLWEINSSTGQKRRLSDQRFNVKQIAASDDSGFLYFIDKNNDSLWSLEISD